MNNFWSLMQVNVLTSQIFLIKNCIYIQHLNLYRSKRKAVPIAYFVEDRVNLVFGPIYLYLEVVFDFTDDFVFAIYFEWDNIFFLNKCCVDWSIFSCSLYFLDIYIFDEISICTRIVILELLENSLNHNNEAICKTF